MRDHGERTTIDGGRTNEQRPPSFSWKVHAIAVWFVRTFLSVSKRAKGGAVRGGEHHRSSQSNLDKPTRQKLGNDVLITTVPDLSRETVLTFHEPFSQLTWTFATRTASMYSRRNRQ